MPFSPDFLRSPEAAALRANRIAESGAKFVVWAEVAHYQHEELDADDADHAERLAVHWVAHGMAISASYRRVLADGTLMKPLGIISQS